MTFAISSWLLLVAGSLVPTQKTVTLDVFDVPQEFAQAMAEFDQGLEVQATNRNRARQLFRSAAERLEVLADSGVTNGYLEYNLGNCYLQAGDIGQAILHYRRAQRMIPGDPRLQDNLKEARSRRLTSIQPRRRSALLRGIFFLHFDTSTQTRMKVAMVTFAGFWIFLIVRSYLRKRFLTVMATVCAIAAVTFATSVAVDGWTDRNAPPGVVTAMDVAAYKGPGTGYQRQFEQPLQPGVEFLLRSKRGDWWQIELPDGKSGWIRSELGELIPPSST